MGRSNFPTVPRAKLGIPNQVQYCSEQSESFSCRLCHTTDIIVEVWRRLTVRSAVVGVVTSSPNHTTLVTNTLNLWSSVMHLRFHAVEPDDPIHMALSLALWLHRSFTALRATFPLFRQGHLRPWGTHALMLCSLRVIECTS